MNTIVPTVTRLNIDHEFRLPSESEDFNNLYEEVKSLWELEDIGISDQLDMPEEHFVQQHYEDTVQYNKNRYEVRLLWKPKLTELLLNEYDLCVSRTKQTNKKHKNSPGQLEQIGKILDEQYY